MLAFAQGVGTQSGSIAPTKCNSGTITDIQSFVCKLNEILSALLPFLVTLGIIYFVWGVVSYVIADDEEAKKKGRDRMIYGIIGLVVIVGVWGLVSWVTTTFGLNNNTTQIIYPTVPY
ncbi:MAG: pilin [bacterium]